MGPFFCSQRRAKCGSNIKVHCFLKSQRSDYVANGSVGQFLEIKSRKYIQNILYPTLIKPWSPWLANQVWWAVKLRKANKKWERSREEKRDKGNNFPKKAFYYKCSQESDTTKPLAFSCGNNEDSIFTYLLCIFLKRKLKCLKRPWFDPLASKDMPVTLKNTLTDSLAKQFGSILLSKALQCNSRGNI